ncbi:MAG: hypothetical protein CVU38_20460 [Chloroflexi bacterium HGW-Chloroflexi-1]|nr:MAG: hypothetical protein CVU38_20460 [Chloroflexi bacterium HGW-Chloroflexi-1]
MPVGSITTPAKSLSIPMNSQRTQGRLYLYAIVAGDQPLARPLAGLADAPVTLLPYQQIAAAVSQVDLDGVKPVGTVLSSAEKVHETLAERYDTYLADLQRLGGQVEIGLRVVWDVEAARPGQPDPQGFASFPGSGGPGARYMLTRVQEAAAERLLKEQAQALAAWCRQRLGPLASDMVTRVLATDGLPVSAAFLVPREGVAALLAEAAQMQRESPELAFVCTGPWPPYHFVERGA